MAKNPVTLSKALQDYIAATGKTLPEINDDVYVAPFPDAPLQGGVNYLKLVATGKQGIDPLVGTHYQDGSKLLSAYLISERKKLGLDMPTSHDPASSAPSRDTAAATVVKRKGKPRKPSATND